MASLNKIIVQIETILNYLEDVESKHFEECSEEERKGHIYPIMCKLRKEIQYWRKMYIAGCRYLMLE